MSADGKHTQEGNVIDCTLKLVFENEMKHWREYREANDKKHSIHFSQGAGHEVRIVRLETKVALYGAVSGVIASLVFSLLQKYLP